jgi:polyisoprenoid-binding protein YceI
MLGKSWLDAKQFPTIEFKADKAVFNKPFTWKIDGKFTLHGVTQDLSITADVRRVPDATAKALGDGAWAKFKTSFKIKLADYGIKIPENAIATVQPEWNIMIVLFGTTVKPAGSPVVAVDEKPIQVARSKPVSEEGIPGTKYLFGKKTQFTQMSATSETDLEKVTASTKTISGVLGIDKESAAVRLRVPVEQLRTGIPLRDEHMLGEQWLNAKAHPDILFESTKALKKDDKSWTIEGNFTMHGVTKPLTVAVVMREIPLELVQKAKWGEVPGVGFHAEFKIKLSDHGINLVEKAIGKVNDEWTVTFDLIALLKE